MTPAAPDIERLLADEHARSDRPKRLPPLGAVAREFTRISEDRYRFTIPKLGMVIDVDRLRRDKHELWGELSVSSTLPGARTVNGDLLSIADFNLSSARARQDRAKLLESRSSTRGELDWTGVLEEFSQLVLQAERAGQPAVDLRTLERPNTNDEMLVVDGLALPKRHPSILFGDGGTGKSYISLFVAGRLAEAGISVALFDWEMCPDDHRDRLERIFPDGMPRILYARCERPLVYEADRLRRIVQENGIQFSVFDSIAAACDGPPEAAEVAGRYFRAVRQIGGGSIHVAHVSKGENADKKPFGSAFWHNGARATWFAQLAEGSADSDVLEVGLFNRKANLGRLRAPVGFSIAFTDQLTTFRRTDVADSPDLAGKLSVPQRMSSLLRKGAMSPEAIAEELDAEVETVKRNARRYKKLFVVMDGGRVGLLERGAS
jgi:hypothetical protein